MNKKQPRKPTFPFGWIRFTRAGEAQKEIFRLSDVKTEQEKDAVYVFRKQMEQSYPKLRIENILQLSERDQDFSVQINGEVVELQLTEISQFQYATKITLEEYRTSPPPLHVMGPSDSLWKIDPERLITSMTESIRIKIDKKYTKGNGSKLWLLIYSTNSLVYAVYGSQGKLYESEMLRLARQYLASLEQILFDEIWFTNLVTRPIRIWPITNRL